MFKAAFIDVDGTLTDEVSSWEKAHMYFDVVDKMKEHTQLFKDKKITYDEWAVMDVKLWKGNTIEELKKAVLPPKLIFGAEDGVKKLQDKGYHVFLVSGGINVHVDEVASLVGANGAFSNKIGHTNGIINGSIQMFVSNKGPIIKQIVKEMNYDLDKCIGIGDNFNDVEMFELVGKSFGINLKDESISQKVDSVFKTNNFYEVVNKILQLV